MDAFEVGVLNRTSAVDVASKSGSRHFGQRKLKRYLLLKS